MGSILRADASPPTAQDLAFLEVVRKHPGITPADFAYAALDAGLLTNRLGRRWKAQGAGRIGGGILAALEKAGLVDGDGRYGREFRLTLRGLRCLEQQRAVQPEDQA